MTVYALMPVFNRLEMTRRMVDDLLAQRLDEALRIVVIDDGSTDGTSDYLKTIDQMLVVNGDGSLWWGGAVDAGLNMAIGLAESTDWVLFVNNDTHICNDFVQRLLDTARRNAPAAVGSVIRQDCEPHTVRSIGPRIDAWRMLVEDLLPSFDANESQLVNEVDALSGRGVLFPVLALRHVRGMRPKQLPHYLADYELSLRVKAAGWRLLIDLGAAVYSKDEYGSTHRGMGFREKFFSVRSPSYLPAQLCFWWQASNFWQKITLPLRLVLFVVAPETRKKL